ncbi:MAG: hypothetical protein JO254_10270 [Pseudolabrys sp.]|nr:hypothetical protein [Pseudolabrys sp.]
MRFAFASIAAAVALSALAVPASAQSRNTVYSNPDRTVSVTRDEDGRTRTRIIVQRRSYLDAGTNVKPGERKFTDYYYGPTYSTTPSTDNTAFTIDKQIKPGPFDLPGSRNPMQIP